MAIIAKIAARPDKPARSFALRKAVTRLPLEPGADVVIVDEETGLVVEGARVVHGPDGVSITLPAMALAAADQAAPEAAGGVSAGADAGNGAGGGSGGGAGLALGVIGGLGALGGLALAAGGGAKGNGNGGNVPTPPADTTPPAAPTGLTLAAADDTGASSSDRITSQTSALTISGTAEAGSTVVLRNGTTALATVTATSGGTFSADVTLPAGAASITATATDAAGNVSPASSALAITVDNAAPAAPTGLVLAAADDTGTSSTDGITSQTSGLTISGTAEAGSTVVLRNGTTTLATVAATSGGTFSADVTLPAGAASITATATDAAGNVSPASSALAITVDATAPAAPTGLVLAAADDTGAASTDGITSQTSNLTISGTAEAGSTVVLRNGTTTLATVTATSGGTFSADVTLPAGAASITATATDAAGNVSPASSALAITVDNAAPAAPTGLVLAAADDTGVSSSDRITGQTSALTISGTAEAGSTVMLRNGTTTLATVTATSGGTFSADVTLPAGAASITATATDAAGNVSPASSALAITVDNAAPAAPGGLTLAAADDTGTSSSDRVTSQTSALTISGTAEAGSTVVLRNGTTTLATVTATSGGTFSADVTLPAGTASITATATDVAGNVSPASSALAITVDNTAPTVAITADASAVLKSTPVTLTFTFSEAPQGFTVDDIVSNGTISNLAVSAGDPRIYTAQLTHGASSDGTLSVSVAAGLWRDAAGNAALASPAFTLPYYAGSGGTAIDGYIANALVFRDADNDGVWDRESFTDANNNGIRDTGEQFVDANGDGRFTAEFATVTDSQGNFANLFGTGRIVLAPLVAGNGTNLSFDISTGAAFTGRYSAPDGATVVTPLTTLVEAIAGAGASAQQIAAAEQQVKAALGVEPTVNLSTFDPFAVAADPADPAQLAAAVAVQKAAVQVANVIAVIAAASEAATSGSAPQAANATVAAIAGLVSSGSPVDLNDAQVLNQIVGAAAPTEVVAQSGAISDALANVNSAVSEAGGEDALTTFAEIVTTQIVAQQTLAEEVAAAIDGGKPLDPAGYEGTALSTKIDAAAGEVQTVLPVEVAATARGAPERPVLDDGARISAAEAGNGLVVSVTFGSGAGVIAGDRLQVKLGDTVVGSVVLASGDIPGSSGSTTLQVPVSSAALGADGTKVFTASFVTAGGVEGTPSLPAIATLDTGTLAPAGLTLSAADDTGLSSSDGLTNRTSGLTISGTAEANAAVSLFDGSTLVGTTNADAAGLFTLDLALSAGPHTLIATAVDAAGNVSTASASLVVTVDATAPGAPMGLVAAEGTLVNVLEAADGTSISGTVEAGNRVAVTFTNGTNTLVKQAVVTGTSFTATLSAADLGTLGTGQISYRAVASDAAGNDSAPSTNASFVFSRDAFVSRERVDTAGSRPDEDLEENGIGVTALSGGGFAVHWVVDVDGDTEADSIAVQRFAADGAKIGGVVVLQNVSPALLDHPGEDPAIDFRSLDGGGYALAYSLVANTVYAPFTFVPGQTSFSFLGAVQAINVGPTPPGVTFSIAGPGLNGQITNVAVTPVNGVIELTPAVLAQFVNAPFGLQVTGLTTGSVNGSVQLKEISYVDGASVLQTSQSTVTVNAGGTAVINGLPGRIEQFDVNAIAGTPTSGTLRISTINPYSISLAGIPNASLSPTGVIQITGVLPDANGIVRIPQAILDQLGDAAAFSILILNGLPASSTVETVISYKSLSLVPEGIFMQTFDAAGVGGPVSTRLDSGGPAADLSDEDNAVSISRLSGGGFAVKWPVDTSGDGETDSIAIQRFTADGTKTGSPVVLQGVDPRLTGHEGDDPAIDLQPLDGGGYALAYTLPLETVGKLFTLTPGEALVSFAGRPSEFIISSAPAGVTFTLTGLSNNGTPLSLAVTPVDGIIRVTQAMLDQFSSDNRMSLRAVGLTTGTVSGFAELKQDVIIDTAAPLQTSSFSGTVTPGGFTGIGLAAGRAEVFDLDQLGGTPTQVSLRIVTGSNQPLDLTGIPNAFITGAGVVQIPVTPDADGVVRVPPSILAQLGNADASIVLLLTGLPAGSAVSATLGVRAPVALPEGVFVQTFDANGIGGTPGVRIDPPAARAELDDEDSGVRVSTLPGGGFAVHWLVDYNGDGDTDALGVQRYAADGSKSGDVVTLQGIDQRLTESESDDIGFDLQALANGGYALAFNLALEENFRQISLSATANNQTFSVPLVGRPTEFLVGAAPANAVISLAGVDNNGAPKVVALSATDGVITITPAILDQFLIDNRLSLRVTGLTAGQVVNVSATTLADVTFDASSPLDPIAATFTALPNGAGVISSPLGRVEGMTIASATYANGTGPSSVGVQIIPAQDALSIDISGVPGATRFPNGVIAVNGLTADAGGAYRIPAALLAQLGENDASTIFIVNGLVAGSTLTGNALVREPDAVSEGVFVQTFGANGQPVSADFDLVGTGGSDVLVGDIGDDMLNGLGGSDTLVAGSGADTLTGGAGDDIFVLESPSGQVLSAADLITDFTLGEDRISLAGGLTFGDVLVVQGNPATNGASATESLIVHSASGDILARLANVEALQVTQASFA